MSLLRGILIAIILLFMTKQVFPYAHVLSNSTRAWKYLPKGQITVITLDTCVDFTHYMLGKKWVFWNKHIGFSVRGTAHCRKPMGRYSHGTMIATTLASFNPRVGILPIAILVKRGSDEERAAAYAAALRAPGRIISMSIGYLTPVHLAMEVLEKIRKTGKLILLAAGNAGRNIEFLGVYPHLFKFDNIMLVGGSYYNHLGQIDHNPSSNFSKNMVHLHAPYEVLFPTTVGYKKRVRGTSFSAPIVASVAAMVWQICPDLEYRSVKRILMDTSQKSYWLRNKSISGGTVDAEAAVLEARRVCLRPRK